MLWKDVPLDGEREFWTGAIRDLQKHGPFKGIAFFSTSRDGTELEHLGLARFGDHTQLIRVHERPSGKLYFFTTPGFELATSLPLKRTEDQNVFAAYDFRFGTLVQLRLFSDDGTRRVEFETPTGPIDAQPVSDKRGRGPR